MKRRWPLAAPCKAGVCGSCPLWEGRPGFPLRGSFLMRSGDCPRFPESVWLSCRYSDNFGQRRLCPSVLCLPLLPPVPFIDARLTRTSPIILLPMDDGPSEVPLPSFPSTTTHFFSSAIPPNCYFYGLKLSGDGCFDPEYLSAFPDRYASPAPQ